MLVFCRCNKKLECCPPAPPAHYITWNCQTATPSLTQYHCRTGTRDQHYSQQQTVPTNIIRTSYPLTTMLALLSFCQKRSFINLVFGRIHHFLAEVNLHCQCYVIFLWNVILNIIKLLLNETFLSITLQLHTPSPPPPVIKSAKHYNHRTTYQHSDHRTTEQDHKEPPCDLFPPAWQVWHWISRRAQILNLID